MTTDQEQKEKEVRAMVAHSRIATYEAATAIRALHFQLCQIIPGDILQKLEEATEALHNVSDQEFLDMVTK